MAEYIDVEPLRKQTVEFEKEVKAMSKAKERYYWYKSHGICVGCSRAEARKGRVYCPQCAADKAYISLNSYYKYREENRAKHNAREKERRQRRIDAGLCAKCGKQKPIIDAERKTGISNGSIGDCLHGRRKTAGGYIWEYAV